MKNVLAIVSDLMFTSKIRAAASESDSNVFVVKKSADLQAIKESGNKIEVIVLDLEARTFDPFEVWTTASEVFPDVPAVGFYSHVNDELAARGEAAGITETMPRSQFVKRLGEIVRGG